MNAPVAYDALRSPCVMLSKVSIPDLHATIFTAMGIGPRTAFDIEGRPFYATIDGTGKAVSGLLGQGGVRDSPAGDQK